MKPEKKGPGRPRQGEEVKEHYSVRLQPQTVEKLIKRYGSLQKAIELLVGHEFAKDLPSWGEKKGNL